MSSVDAKFIDQSTQNINILKSEERRESVTIFGLSLPAVLTILIVVFLPIFWLSSLSFYNAAGELKDAPTIAVPSLGVTAKAVAACLTIVFCGIILFFKYINK